MGAPVPVGGGGGGGGGGCAHTVAVTTKNKSSSTIFFIRLASKVLIFLDKNGIGVCQCHSCGYKNNTFFQLNRNVCLLLI